MKKKVIVRNPIAHADGGVSEGKTFNRTVKTKTFPEIEPFIWDYGNIYDWSAKKSCGTQREKFCSFKEPCRKNKRVPRKKSCL